MKYTFVAEDGKQKTVNIPDEDIRRFKAAFGLSNKEAIDMWLVDEGYKTDPVVEELNAKARANGSAKSKTSRKPRKEDPTKRALIASLFDCIQEYAGVVSAEIRNPERIISFTLGDDRYEITLSKKRK